MFMTIRRYKGKPGHTDEIVRLVKQGLAPILAKQKGFISYQAIDAGHDVAVSVSVYDSRADAEAANTAAGGWVKEHLAGLVGPADVTVGEVVVSANAARV